MNPNLVTLFQPEEWRVKILRVSYELLMELFLNTRMNPERTEILAWEVSGLPKDARIQAMSLDLMHRHALLRVYSTEFPDVPPGSVAEEMEVTIRQRRYRITVPVSDKHKAGLVIENPQPETYSTIEPDTQQPVELTLTDKAYPNAVTAYRPPISPDCSHAHASYCSYSGLRRTPRQWHCVDCERRWMQVGGSFQETGMDWKPLVQAGAPQVRSEDPPVVAYKEAHAKSVEAREESPPGDADSWMTYRPPVSPDCFHAEADYCAYWPLRSTHRQWHCTRCERWWMQIRGSFQNTGVGWEPLAQASTLEVPADQLPPGTRFVQPVVTIASPPAPRPPDAPKCGYEFL